MKHLSKRFGAVALAAAVLMTACTEKSDPLSGTVAATSQPSESTSPAPATGDGGTTPPSVAAAQSAGVAPRLFSVKLSQGKLAAEPASAATVAAGEPLSELRLAELTGRLPKWEDPASLTAPFAWPKQAPPPPRTGNTVDLPFPPKVIADPPVTDNGPLKVLRVQPEGEVPIAPYFTVTFNQPMVAVGTVAQVSAVEVPVKLDPAVPGTWQWIGTRTLRFDADSALVDRLPMATAFTATIPAGTRSVAGGSLVEAATFTFATPPPAIVNRSISESTNLPLDPVVVWVFDQRVDPAAVLKTVTWSAAGKPVPVRLATTSEIDSDESAKGTVSEAEPGRWIAVRPVNPLPKDAGMRIGLGPVPSAEGPRLGQVEWFAGRTYGPLKVLRKSCTYGDECPPGTGFYIEFTNALDAKAQANIAARVAVKPALAVQKVTIDGVVSVEGATQPRTTYDVTLPAGLTDVYGQTLGKDEVVSFTIGAARKMLRQLEWITTLDPFAKTQKLSVLSTNHKKLRVRVFQADPAKFAEYAAYAARRFDDRVALPEWRQLSDRRISVTGDNDATTETLIDLGSELDSRPGQVIVLVEADPTPSRNSEEYYQNQPVLTWVQSTTMALDSFTDADEMRVWATDLRTGAAIGDLTVATPTGTTKTTDASGLAVFALEGKVIEVVRGVRGGESFILPVSVTATPTPDTVAWYAFDDRQIYRPGETVSIKGWARDVSGKTGALNVSAQKTATYVVNDAFGVELGKGSIELGALGGFDLTFAVPMTANIGGASIVFSGAGGTSQWAHGFQIAEFRRPEFEVDVQPVVAGPFLSNQSVTMATKAAYFAGGPLPGAPVNWTVSTRETTFSPAGWDTFTFGIFRPWWWGEDFGRTFPGGPGGFGEQTVKNYSGTTDASGRHALQLDFTGEQGKLPDLPVSVSVAGTVTDVNRQAWSDSQSILVHSANRYVGLRSDRAFVREGDPLQVEVVVTDVDGAVKPGSTLGVTAGLLRSDYVDGKLVEEVIDPQTCDLTSAAEPSLCTFKTPVGGQYRITTSVNGATGGSNRTQLSVWVSGAASQPARTVEQEQLTIVPDKQRYAPGDTAKLLLQAPFLKGEGLMVITHGSGVRETKRFSAADGSAQVEVPVTEADVPGIGITAEVAGASDRVGFDGAKVKGAPQRPAYAVGSISLSVPPLTRTLAVVAKPVKAELAPGESTSIDVSVKDSVGSPVQGAEFAVVVVDEAVLGLTGYRLANPIDIFYGAGYSSLATRFGREQVRLVDPLSIVASAPQEDAAAETAAAASDSTDSSFDNISGVLAEAAPGAPQARKSAASGGDGQASAPVAVRSNFDALALFRPTVITNAAGNASVEVKLPDNLTRYRVMVVAVSGNDRFGTAESTITARLPLSIRPSAPRFLNTGDSFELPVVVQNLDARPMTVDVLVQVANLAADGPLAKQVTVPANDRLEVRFPVAVKQAGTARVRVSGFAANAADSAEVSIPVFTPGTTEAFATYGTLDSGSVRQPILAPTDVIDTYGGLEVSTSSTSLQALTDALLFISEYDYQSSDAYASRIMSIGALRKVLRDFQTAELPSEADLNAAVDRDIAGLIGLQNDDGGWSYWRRFDRSEPFNSVQATHALVLAKQAGYSVDQRSLDRALQYLAMVEQYIGSDYGERYRDMVRAYALWVRAFAGQRDSNKAAELFRERGEKLNLDALAWLWGSLDDVGTKATVERTITNRAVDTAGALSFASGYTDSDYLTLGSDRRTDAIVLDALIANTPTSDMVDKVVAGLLAHRTKGRWDNSQENTFVLLALKRYYDTYESVAPDFIARVWLGNQFAGESTFKGRSTDRVRIDVPMAELIKGGNRDLILQRDGAGRLYYRIGLKYVPADLTLDALDRGFVVKRTYESVDNPDDVRQDADGTWRIKAGAKVRIRLTMVAESQRTFVALVDPLPAGLEALNPDLAVTQPIPENPNDPNPLAKVGWWWGNWYAHQQFRDDRSEAFTTYLPAGVYDFSYIARATTPGSFVVPPTRAEEMYAPETFGRAATDRVVVSG